MIDAAIGRRSALALGLASGAATLVRPARAQAPKEVKIAMLVPLSGPWARSGVLERFGAEMAIDDVNTAGGIRAMGGARLRLMPFDTQDSAEKTKDAAQRLLAQEPDLVGGFGCWLSSFTLAATEVTERAGLPWLTLSYSDLITGRGYRYVFQTAPTADSQAKQLLPNILDLAEKATGKRPRKIGILADNTASNVSFLKEVRERTLKELNLTAVMDQMYTPPIADATTLVQPVRSARPDFCLMLASNVPDDKLLLDKFAEFGLAGGKLPLIGGGGHIGAPELLKVTGAEILQGLMSGLANWPGRDLDQLAERFMARTKEPWFGHDSLFGYVHVLILKEALERAGAANRQKVAEAIRTLDLRDGPALFFPGGHLRFDEKGRRVDAKLAIIQWQNGRPLAIYPPEIAAAPALWPRSV